MKVMKMENTRLIWNTKDKIFKILQTFRSRCENQREGDFQSVYTEIAETVGHNKHWSDPALNQQCRVCWARSVMRYMRSNVKCDVVLCVARNGWRSATQMTTSGTSFLPSSFQRAEALKKWKERLWIFTNFLETYFLHYTVRIFKAF
jgi:hypothetical protein